MIEVEVHQQLRAFLRGQGESHWPHHLTLARLVARALRLGRSALIQAVPTRSYRSYRLGYLTPLLLWPEPAVLVAPPEVQRRLLSVEIPRLRSWMPTSKAIQQGDRWPGDDFKGLLMTTPEAWLGDRLFSHSQHLGQGQNHFPDGIPTLIEGADDLEQWLNQQLQLSLAPADWDSLMLACPLHSDIIRETRVQLTHELFQHPSNPYGCYLLDASQQASLAHLFDCLAGQPLPAPWLAFMAQFGQPDRLFWGDLARAQGQFTLHCQPLDLAGAVGDLWERQPLVLIGEAMDPEPQAERYRQQLGLGDLTCVQFSPDRQTSQIQLYIPESLPLPNTARYQGALLQELRRLLALSEGGSGPVVLLINDLPLKGQISAALAAEFGSRLQVEQTCLDENSLLVSGWDFWKAHQGVLPAPRLLLMATLPFPSLEHPLVAGRVAFYKGRRQDWFRRYLLPQCLRDLQRAIAPVREAQGVVGLFDTRVIHRSYGQQILAALSPAARLSYLEPELFDGSMADPEALAE